MSTANANIRMTVKVRKNQNMKDVSSSSTGCKEQSNFTKADRQKLSKIYDTVENLTRQVSNLQRSLKRSNKKIKELKSENEQLKQAVNMNIQEIDNLEQYSRRENIRIHGVPEPQGKKDDGEEVVVELAEKLGVNIESYDIQRAHRLGRKRSPLAKPCPIIARFVKYKHRNDILFSKSKLKNCNNGKFNNAFITEDLTPLRSKLLNYVKNDCDGKFQRWSPRGRPWPRGRSRGHILKSLALALASRPQVLENWPVLGSRTALFRGMLKFCGVLEKFFGKRFLVEIAWKIFVKTFFFFFWRSPEKFL